ncbi:hypothetical protein [Pseudomonas cannabina]|uniref:hypothetical protein n=1 Tax=Pseudomonas cannabina TaxID=86840 RepID=UPI0011C45201|nr:hypothetical protein [Pseudomonas cannabina]
MSLDSSDMGVTNVELSEAIKTFASLANSMQRIDGALRAQGDLQLLELFYSEAERRSLFDSFDAAERAYDDACETVLLCSKRSSDQRTFEQYANAHGQAQAERAFTPMDVAGANMKELESAFAVLKLKNPVIARVRTRIKNGF